MRQRFLNWCENDIHDNKKIYYTCHINKNEEPLMFTSEDEVPYSILSWLHNEAYIDAIWLGSNGYEYFVILSGKK